MIPILIIITVVIYVWFLLCINFQLNWNWESRTPLPMASPSHDINAMYNWLQTCKSKKNIYAVIMTLPLPWPSPCAAYPSLCPTAQHIFVLLPCNLHKVEFWKLQQQSQLLSKQLYLYIISCFIRNPNSSGQNHKLWQTFYDTVKFFS